MAVNHFNMNGEELINRLIDIVVDNCEIKYDKYGYDEIIHNHESIREYHEIVKELLHRMENHK